ncbi:hypothetical protein TNCV_4471681 [Trichonephila clavipes]|uniref:Uncharacterized protein n=1 Tax=Trichonephila clavipes TaxID=2585209 RepID=A0A8X6VAK8_TRICX|nr:hypothetical protein TNCV_4471681 [Trichonephila clavipes]
MGRDFVSMVEARAQLHTNSRPPAKEGSSSESLHYEHHSPSRMSSPRDYHYCENISTRYIRRFKSKDFNEEVLLR